MERLQKVIADKGYTSRRKAEDLIINGKVYVNGVKVTKLGTKVEDNDIIEVEGNKLINNPDKEYILLNKPRGVICSLNDEVGRKTVVDLIDTNKRIYPIGRLDYDTTGLIILTNDGTLANILMHPRNGIEKKYIARLNKVFEIKDLKTLSNGVNIDGIKCKPTRVKIKKTDKENNYSLVEITITEGRNHIVKKVFNELGYLVDKLTRVEYAFLTLEGLKSGEYRNLTLKEVKKLYGYKKS